MAYSKWVIYIKQLTNKPELPHAIPVEKGESPFKKKDIITFKMSM